MGLSVEQRGVLLGMAGGMTISVALVVVGVRWNPFGYGDDLDTAARFGIAARSAILPAILLAASIGRLAGHRFFTPEDIDGGGLTAGSPEAKVLQSLLQNTLEQTLLAALTYAAWAAFVPGTWMSVVPLAALCFVLGRVLFVAGYEKGAPTRALGFTLTFYPTLVMLVCLAGRALL